MPTNPKYLPRAPIYVISKNRTKYLYTAKSLEDCGVPYYMAVEQHQVQEYEDALGEAGHKLHTVLSLPFSNHGHGSVPARNACWEHSIDLGAKRHWVMDDNIRDFYRFHHNRRIRVATGAMFRAMEDYCDRYKNVMLAGPQYHFFCPDRLVRPAVLQNTRLMSCILIQNDCRHRWRGRYNEDVDISLQVLKDGDCTLLFYAFLCGKLRTSTIPGGNTDEFYANEGTFKKSQMLARLHPDVTTLVQRYGRWHHHVDMRPFRENKLIYADDFDPASLGNGAPNEYGMKLMYRPKGGVARELTDKELENWDFWGK